MVFLVSQNTNNILNSLTYILLNNSLNTETQEKTTLEKETYYVVNSFDNYTSSSQNAIS